MGGQKDAVGFFGGFWVFFFLNYDVFWFGQTNGQANKSAKEQTVLGVGGTWEVILPKVDLRAQGLLFHVNTNLR